MKFEALVCIPLLLSASAAPDLLKSAKAGNPLSFDVILDARFGSEESGPFDALRTWAERPTPQELSEHYRRRPGPKDLYVERVPCWEADHKSLLRAMTVAAGAADRQSAQAIWGDVERAFRSAQKLERERVEDARAEGRSRPTEIGRELTVRAARDQAWRAAQIDRAYDDRTSEAIMWRLWSNQCHIGSDNVAFVKSLISRGRWPLRSRDGEAATHDAFLIVQHADDDPGFQKHVLDLLGPVVARGEFPGNTYAALFDRVALAEGRPQRYGTQFESGEGQCMTTSPIENPEDVDRRRAEVGLKPLAEYARKLSGLYHMKICGNMLRTSEKL